MNVQDIMARGLEMLLAGYRPIDVARALGISRHTACDLLRNHKNREASRLRRKPAA